MKSKGNYLMTFFCRKIISFHENFDLFLTGCVGIGKTSLLLLLVEGMHRYYNNHIMQDVDITLPKVLMLAYTGKSFYDINGMAIQLALHLLIHNKVLTFISRNKLHFWNIVLKIIAPYH